MSDDPAAPAAAATECLGVADADDVLVVYNEAQRNLPAGEAYVAPIETAGAGRSCSTEPWPATGCSA